MDNRWDKKGVPHKDWSCVGSEDLGEASGSCEMCNKESVRFIHIMKHRDYEGEMRVGCVCAEKMESDSKAPRHRERNLKSIASRRSRWLKRKWKQSEKGNLYINVDNFNIVVMKAKSKLDNWTYCVDQKFSESTFKTEEAAKLAVFDRYLQLKNEVVNE